jgi:hypothetical protein
MAYSAGGTPASLSSFKHDHIGVTGSPMLEKSGGKRAGETTADDNNVCCLWQVFSCPVTKQLLGGLFMPVRLGWG